MFHKKRPIQFVLFLVFSLLGLAPVLAQESDAPLIVFLVRHAEKLDTSTDAALSEKGKKRAQTLANSLRDANITHIHSSDFRRTRDTAKPLASRLKKSVQIYDPADLSTLIAKIKTAPGKHLVVGHSNTTPAVAKLLGGEPGPPIDEPTEYDRLYIITLQKENNTHTILLRY